MPLTPPVMIARGTIAPSRFVRQDTATNRGVLQATANSKILGISQPGTNYAPLSDVVSTSNAAVAGQELQLYSIGEVCKIEAGGVITAGDWLKSDANGKAVSSLTAGTTVQFVGAQALENATAAGQLIDVLVMIFPYLPAVA